MSPNRSLAAWCASAPNAEPSAFEAHFNYWRIAGDEEFCRDAKVAVRDFIEIGIKLDTPAAVAHVCIFVPHPIAAGALTDCSPYLLRGEVAQGIFNEVLNVTDVAGGRSIELASANGVFCRAHKFMTAGAEIDASELTRTTILNGTLLTITPAALREARRHSTPPAPTYFRFRLWLNENTQQTYVRNIPTPDHLFQSGYDEIEYIDFRLNEARTLPEQIETKMREELANENVELRLVAFLTAIPVQSDLAITSTNYHKLRLLEHALWSPYVESGIPEGMTVYHWKKTSEKGKIADFSAFVKLRTRRSGRYTLRNYVTVAFLFGLLGNLIASGLQVCLSAAWIALSGKEGSEMQGSPPSAPVSHDVDKNQ